MKQPQQTFEFSTQWFGYHKRDTQTYLRKLVALQERDIHALQEEIRIERAINDKYQQQLSAIEEKEGLFRRGVHDEDRMNRLYADRLTRTMEAIQRQGKAEIEALENLYEYCQNEYNQFLERMDQQFIAQQQEVERMIEKAIRNLETIRASQDDEALEALIETTEDTIRFLTTADVPDRLIERNIEKMKKNTMESQALNTIVMMKGQLELQFPEAVEQQKKSSKAADLQTSDFWDDEDSKDRGAK